MSVQESRACYAGRPLSVNGYKLGTFCRGSWFMCRRALLEANFPDFEIAAAYDFVR